MTHEKSTAESSGSPALGCFVVGQILFLLLANVLPFLRTAARRLPEPAPWVFQALQADPNDSQRWPGETPEKIIHAWEDLTGQNQNWSLFAPAVARESAFPMVILRWDDPPNHPAAVTRVLTLFAFPGGPGCAAAWSLVRPGEHGWYSETILAGFLSVPFGASHPFEALVLSREFVVPGDRPMLPWPLPSPNEPADPRSYFRLGGFRHRRFEGTLLPSLETTGSKSHPQWKARVRDIVRDHVLRKEFHLRGFLRWRLNDLEESSPCRWNPRSLVLAGRYFRHRPPGSSPPWSPPIVLPLARWTVPNPGDSHPGPLEWYDPVAGGFRPLAP